MKLKLAILGLIISSNLVHGQFIGNGVITFERQTNLKMSMKYEWEDDGNDVSSWRAAMLEKMPKYQTSYFTLSFNEQKCEYAFDRDDEAKLPMWGGKGPARENRVVTDFITKTFTSEKEIYETKFIVKDSLTAFKWKILDEIREIAGYPCRKATTVICDSVVVVAFYTDQIMVSGGPETFNGLPGMILGLAIPRLYTTWYATKVDLVPFDDTTIKAPKKGKTVNSAEMIKSIGERLSEWGSYGTTTLWWASL
jgi:GLPGLI family protein